MTRSWFPALLVAALAVTLLFLTLPIVAIFVNVGPLDLVGGLDDEGALDALRLSLLCSATAVAVIVLVGTPAAYLLATRRFRGRAGLVARGAERVEPARFHEGVVVDERGLVDNEDRHRLRQAAPAGRAEVDILGDVVLGDAEQQ